MSVRGREWRSPSGSRGTGNVHFKSKELKPFVSPPARSLRQQVASASLLRKRRDRVALRPRSSGSGFDCVRDIIHLINIIIVVNINNRKTLFTAYALSAQDDSAGVERVLNVRSTRGSTLRVNRSLYSAGSGVRDVCFYGARGIANVCNVHLGTSRRCPLQKL